MTELSVASTIFVLVVAGVVSSNIFGLRMIELTEPKQQAAQRARELINQLTDDISTAWLVEVGNGDLSNFVPVQRGDPKRGNALKIIPYGDDPGDFVVYYKDSATDEFMRDQVGAAAASVVARGVMNNQVFAGEDSRGVVLTEDQATMVLAVSLQFAELERTQTPVGPDYTYKSYQFQTRLTWRAR